MNLECNVCYREFKRQWALEAHKIIKHKAQDGLKCKKCGATRGRWHQCLRCNNDYCSLECREKDHIKCFQAHGLGCYSLPRLGHAESIETISLPTKEKREVLGGDLIYATA